MHRIFIDGQAGTTGLEISQRLRARADIELLEIDAELRKQPQARLELMAEADVTVLCLPDSAAIEAVALADGQTRFLDASTAHRISADWVYGCPELTISQRSAIARAQQVSNPGCYPQGFILLIRPLIEAGLLQSGQALSVSGVSGYSGGGRALIEKYQSFSATDADRLNTRPYGLALQHKHLPEMHTYSTTSQAPLFLPAVGNYYRGMLIEVPLFRAQLSRHSSGEDLTQCLSDRYADEPFVEVLPFNSEQVLSEGFLDATHCNGTNLIQLMLFGNAEQMMLIARYDNLGKGASGAAVQNLNIMLGLDEQLGLSGSL